ncbi:MAG: NADH-quinone oxidoreductase subunit L [Acidimicrobiia bacterium]
MEASLWLTIALPLAGAVVLLFFGKRIGEPWSGYLAAGTVFVAFLVAAANGWEFITGDEEHITVFLYEWIPALGVDASLLWDPLSMMLTLVVTGVGFLIHVFAIGYMHGDPRYGRFFAYLNLFVASMLVLVLADNFGLLFVGWELVGLCSYLLISFWFEKPTAAAAGNKAFIVNRIGDVGFLIALMLMFAAFGTLDYATVFESAEAVLGFDSGTATAITLLLLVGAIGKSAQVPLYVWLPDAMEGPTPVSALIHAATMVTAGVYMVVRSGVLYDLAPISAAVVAVIGAVTLLWAAVLAVGQSDIKRVLAYSTISQLGYMFMAAGVAAYSAAVFHLVTHAFFKALLFLGAGSVIHAMSDQQNMWKMGGLRKFLPITFGTMAVAWLAIAGMPPFAGFWSKDEILALTFAKGGWWVVLWGIGLLGAVLTGFYMSRMMFLTFWTKPRFDEAKLAPHESPLVMTIPLLVLAVLSFGFGFFGTPFRNAFEHFLHPALEMASHVAAPSTVELWMLAFISVSAGAVGIFLAWNRYLRRDELPDEWGRAWQGAEAGFYVDNLYNRGLVQPGKAVAVTSARFDKSVVDGAVNAVGWVVVKTSAALRPLQSGYVRSYGLGIMAGAVGLLIWFVSRAGGL